MRIAFAASFVAAAGLAGSIGVAAASPGPHHAVPAGSAKPAVTALHVTKRAAHRLSFSARVDPNGLATKASLVAKHKGRTVGGANRSAGSGSSPTTLHFTITHLHAHRTFTVEVFATSTAGTGKSQVITVTTRRLSQ
jgi:hypothetical protein